MKKVLIAFDGIHIPNSALEFALDLNNESPVMLTGVFLPSMDYADFLNYTYHGLAVPACYTNAFDGDKQKIEKNKEAFRKFCNDHHIKHKIHDDITLDIQRELCEETRFADLLILNNLQFSEEIGEVVQEDYIERTLHKTECPVVLLPAFYKKPESIVIGYDGSTASMFAIKQFICTLPHLTNLNTLLVYIGKEHQDIPSWELIKEYAPNHFNKLAIFKLDINSKKYLNNWLQEKNATMFVSGSYGRNIFSELFKHTFVKDLIQACETPLFIAHP